MRLGSVTSFVAITGALFATLSTAAFGQTALNSGPVPTSAKAQQQGPSLSLTSVESFSEVARELANPECDAKGNLYFDSWPDGAHAIHKLSASGKRLATLLPEAPGVRVDMPLSFSIAANGDIYQLIHGHDGRYVFVYGENGGIKSVVKLHPGFKFKPSRVVAFANGDLLVIGLEYDEDRNNPVMWPFTGIFSPDGTLKKELNLADDDEIHGLASSGAPQVLPATDPSANIAVQGGTAKDGSIYVMRRLAPAIIYAISKEGEVRRFTVDPGRPGYAPGIGSGAMQISGDRIAIPFFPSQTGETIVKIVDLNGHEIATYTGPPEGAKPNLGMGFACYATQPTRLTFLGMADDYKLELISASPN